MDRAGETRERRWAKRGTNREGGQLGEQDDQGGGEKGWEKEYHWRRRTVKRTTETRGVSGGYIRLQRTKRRRKVEGESRGSTAGEESGRVPGSRSAG